jgi:hypothetical protein
MGSTRAGSKVGAVNSAPSSEQRRPRSRLFGVRGDQDTSRSLMIDVGVISSDEIGLLTVISAACVMLFLGLSATMIPTHVEANTERSVDTIRNFPLACGCLSWCYVRCFQCPPRAAQRFLRVEWGRGYTSVRPRLLTAMYVRGVVGVARRRNIF